VIPEEEEEKEEETADYSELQNTLDGAVNGLQRQGISVAYD